MVTCSQDIVRSCVTGGSSRATVDKCGIPPLLILSHELHYYNVEMFSVPTLTVVVGVFVCEKSCHLFTPFDTWVGVDDTCVDCSSWEDQDENIYSCGWGKK